jgi:uncharacterized small protein (DUF1192 family)
VEPINPVSISAALTENATDPTVLTATVIQLTYYIAALQDEIALLQDELSRLRMDLVDHEQQRRHDR